VFFCRFWVLQEKFLCLGLRCAIWARYLSSSLVGGAVVTLASAVYYSAENVILTYHQDTPTEVTNPLATTHLGIVADLFTQLTEAEGTG
jgi:hypothetical protein